MALSEGDAHVPALPGAEPPSATKRSCAPSRPTPVARDRSELEQRAVKLQINLLHLPFEDSDFNADFVHINTSGGQLASNASLRLAAASELAAATAQKFVVEIEAADANACEREEEEKLRVRERLDSETRAVP